MFITANEFQMNFSKYLDMAATEDLMITRDGQTVAMLVKPVQTKKSAVGSLRGLLKGIPELDIREERVYKYEDND